MAGWGRSTWGNGPWGQPAVTLVNVTGVAGTSALGSETVIAKALVVVTGLMLHQQLAPYLLYL